MKNCETTRVLTEPRAAATPAAGATTSEGLEPFSVEDSPAAAGAAEKQQQWSQTRERKRRYVELWYQWNKQWYDKSLCKIVIQQNRNVMWQWITMKRQTRLPNLERQRHRRQLQQRQNDWDHRRSHQGSRRWSAWAWEHRASLNLCPLWMRRQGNGSQWKGKREG